MAICIRRLPDSASLASLLWFRHDRPVVMEPHLDPIDLSARADDRDERDPLPPASPVGPSGDRPEPVEHGKRDAPPRTGRERLEATNARIHVATESEPATAGYGLFTNETMSNATLIGLESPAFDRIEMRVTHAIGDVTVMRTMNRVTVLPGASVEFSPGGRRLMMTGPRRPLKEGQLVGVTLLFSSGRSRVVPFRVATIGS